MIRTRIKKNRRVLIAGAKFGEIYFNAFMQPQPGLELAGLFARGSRRAQQLAHDFGVPLYTHLAQVPDDIDIACIVIRSTVAQGEGSQIAAEFLNRGIHVVQEHPLHPDDLYQLQSLARERDRLYWVNSVYPYVPAGRCWIDRAARIRSLMQGQLPCSAHLSTSRQLLYSTLDLLLQACGVTDANAVRAKKREGADACFSPVGLELPGGSQAALRLQSYLDPADPDMFSLVMHHASLFWPSGYLTLESSYGPVIWTGTFHDPQHGNHEHTLYRYANDVEGYSQPPSLVLHDAPRSWRDAFEVDAAAAIGHVLQSMRQTLDGGPIPSGVEPAYQLALARLWLEILRITPPAVEKNLMPPRAISWDELTDGMPEQHTSRRKHG